MVMVMLHIYAKSRFISAKAKQPWISSTDSTIQSFNSSHSKPQAWPQTWLIDLWKTIASRDAIPDSSKDGRFCRGLCWRGGNPRELADIDPRPYHSSKWNNQWMETAYQILIHVEN